MIPWITSGIFAQQTSSSQPKLYPYELKSLGRRVANWIKELGGDPYYTPSHLEIIPKPTSPFPCRECNNPETPMGTVIIKRKGTLKQIKITYRMIHDLKEHGVVRESPPGRPYFNVYLLKEIIDP